VIENEHVRVVYGTALPFTLFSLKILVKPSPVSEGVFPRAAVGPPRVAEIVFFIYLLFAGAAVGLEAVFSRGAAVGLARVFQELAPTATLPHTGLRNDAGFRHRSGTSLVEVGGWRKLYAGGRPPAKYPYAKAGRRVVIQRVIRPRLCQEVVF
jgi:hypothetical protein